MYPVILAYPAIFVGVFFEGEFFFFSSIIAGHSGHLNIWVVVLMGYSGAVSADSFFFLIGRRNGIAWIKKRAHMKNHLEKAMMMLAKHENKILLSYRFIYGFRSIIPVLLGTYKISYRKFFLFSIFSNLIWASVITALGLYMGAFILKELKHYEQIEFWVIGLLALCGLIYFLFKKRTFQKRFDVTPNPEG